MKAQAQENEFKDTVSDKWACCIADWFWFELLILIWLWFWLDFVSDISEIDSVKSTTLFALDAVWRSADCVKTERCFNES
jgi:hypothetical protein